MKIAIVSFYNGIIERGLEGWVTDLSKRLSDKNEVVVYQSGQGVDETIQTRVFPVKVDKHRIGRSGLLKRFFLDYWGRKVGLFSIKISLDLFRGNYDIVVPTNGGWEAFLVRIVCWLRGSKMVVVGHSGKGWDDRINLLSFPDCFVGLTENACYWARKVNPWVKVKHISNGVDLKLFSPTGQKIKTSLKQPIVLCVSALVPTKRIDLTIKAVAKFEDVSLFVVGDGPERDSLEKLGKQLLGSRFQIESFKFEDMPKVYRAGNLFTMCSWLNESSPLVYLQAMASGLAVVATDDPNRREIVSEAGIFVDPNDVDGYSKALKEALNKDWRNIPIKQAEKFSWEKIASEYYKLFISLK